MISLDTTKNITHEHVFQVISSSNNMLYYFDNIDQNTTPSSILCRIIQELYKPRVKIREAFPNTSCTIYELFYSRQSSYAWRNANQRCMHEGSGSHVHDACTCTAKRPWDVMLIDPCMLPATRQRLGEMGFECMRGTSNLGPAPVKSTKESKKLN